ncbi:hypothetical protein AB0A77_26840 [Streptomyces varsoviensis]|uniref:HelD family protein n=1 Tax=Streptomyces varsoviensis TaxID=67373 RepID=UPI0033D978CE
MSTLATSAFDLPDHLSAKADPALIHGDERHFAAVAACLEETIAELAARLDDARKAPGGIGRAAMDRDAEVHRLTARLRTLRRFGLDLCLGRIVPAGGAGDTGGAGSAGGAGDGEGAEGVGGVGGSVSDDRAGGAGPAGPAEPVYIGRLGLTDSTGRRLLLDWRSPAAEPFFAATHANPLGLISRRRYRWTRGRISDYWDEVFTADGLQGHAALDDQSAFIASLGGHRSDRMRDVLATIQADQDAIIRAGSRGALVVDGGPGTGKTVVALHRAAHLLYSDPRLGHRRGGLLFVGPSRPYLAYVSDVLPSLGEEGVQTCVLRDLVEEGAAAAVEADPRVAALKATADLVKAVEPAVALYEEPPTEGMTVSSHWTDIWLSAADWATAFAAVEPGTPHNEARDQILEALLTILVDKAGVEEEGAGGGGFGGEEFGDERFGGEGFGDERFGGEGFGGERFSGEGFGDERFGGDGLGGERFGGDGFGEHGGSGGDGPVPSPDLLRRSLRQDRGLIQTLHRAWPMIEPADLVGDLWSVPAYLRKCAPWLSPDEVRALQRPEAQAWTVSDLPFLDAARQRLGDPHASARERRRAAAVAAERARRADVIAHILEDSDIDESQGAVGMLRGRDIQDTLIDEDALPGPEPDLLAGPFAHIIVDEAQELTDAEWQMLLRRCPSRSFTIVGDRAQARHGFTEPWRERLARAGLDRTTVATLGINYRTPEEVMAEAEPAIRAVFPDANVPASIRGSGIPVAHGSVADLDAVLDAWLAEHADGEGIACVIGVPEPRRAVQAVHAASRVLRTTPRVRSLTPELSKGLEFDLVVLLDPDGFGDGIEGAVDRYVAMTRATQRLVILTSA